MASSDNTDFSSDSTISDDWQELTKSDYAKVIFSDLSFNAVSGNVECKFQITDNVHEDPNDYVGLYRIGYDDLSQCLVSKMLSQTKCEDDGKLQRCVFASDELPHLDDGFYQFLYVTRDQEVCGASMPFQIRKPCFQAPESSTESVASEKMDGGFLVVNNEMEKKVDEMETKIIEMNRQMKKYEEREKNFSQQSALSESKKEEIAAWISHNPDYYSLIEQIKEHTFTIDALQQSKDLAMREVGQLYEVLGKQNTEINQLKNMLAAYEEKIKMSQTLQEEKNIELIQMRNKVATLEEQINLNRRIQEEKKLELIQMRSVLTACAQKFKTNLGLQQEKSEALIEMRKLLTAFEEKNKKNQYLLQEKEEQLNQLKKELAQQVEKLNMSRIMLDQQNGELTHLKRELGFREEASENIIEKQRIEISKLKKELEEMKEIQKANETHQVPEASSGNTEVKGTSLEEIIEKAQALLHMVTSVIQNLDFTNEDEVEKFYQLKIQLLIIQSKMGRVTDIVNSCDRNQLHEKLRCISEKNVIAQEQRVSLDCSASPAVEDQAPPYQSSNVNEPEEKKPVVPSSSVIENKEDLSLPDASSNLSRNEPNSIEECVEVVEGNTTKPEVLVHPIIELPRLEVINEDAARMLQMEMEDVVLINRLTEKIINRDPNLYTAIELVDDSSSECESDMSEISDKDPICSSMKKYLLSLANVMKALHKDLPTLTTLENLVVVKNEEDKRLLCRKECGVLLQKCALRYQTEILFEHIEKQKEGLKKVSDRICDLLTKYMVLTDELNDSKSTCEKLQRVLDLKDKQISRLDSELEQKNIIICQFCCQKAELENRADIAEKTVADYAARIVEAADLYKDQYKEIERLSKKLRKYKSLNYKVMSSKRDSSVNSSVSSETACSFEVVEKGSIQNVSDNDTGEHMFAKDSAVSNEVKQMQVETNEGLQACASESSDPSPFMSVSNLLKRLSAEELDDAARLSADLSSSSIEIVSKHIAAAETPASHSNQTASAITDCSSYRHFQDTIKDNFVNVKKDPESRSSQESFISCYFCDEMFSLAPDVPIDLMNHLDEKHSMKTCPVCGELFEDAVPQRYFQIHVNHHFKPEYVNWCQNFETDDFYLD